MASFHAPDLLFRFVQRTNEKKRSAPQQQQQQRRTVAPGHADIGDEDVSLMALSLSNT